MTDFLDIVNTKGLSPDEEARLRRVHELLVEAGPPPDLPPALQHPHEQTRGEIVQFPLLPKRRWTAAAVIAATLVIVGFGGGYLLGHSKSKPAAFATQRLVSMHGRTALALLRIGPRDSAGNWPMQLEVNGLPKQHSPGAYYELWLTRHGRPVVPCGSFRVHDNITTVSLTVPYTFSHYGGWVVTTQPGDENVPGHVILAT